MAKITKNQLTIIVIISCVALVFGIKFYIESSRGGFAKGLHGRANGNKRGKVHIVEYVDFQCPACAHGSKLLHKVLEKYPDDIYIEIKYFPLGMHRHAFTGARYAECAVRQDKFWPFLNLMFSRQSQWKVKLDAQPDFRKMAQEVEIDMSKLDICLQDEAINKIILKEKEMGSSLGIKSTPTYFVNNKMVVGTKSLMRELSKHIKIDMIVN